MNKDFEVSSIDLKNRILVAYNGNETVVEIPEFITAIGNHAFKGCAAEKIIFGKDVKSVSFEAFCHCPNLKEIIFNEGMEFIETCFIDSCPKLDEITLPQSLTRVVSRIFGFQNHQIKVNIPDSLEVLVKGAFDWIDENENLVPYDEKLLFENKNYGVRNGIFFNRKNHTALFLMESTQELLEIPEEIEKIGQNCFVETPLLNWENNRECYSEAESEIFKKQKHLKKVYFPKTTVKIDECAFYCCEKLEEIYFDCPKENVSISPEAFFDMKLPKLIFTEAACGESADSSANDERVKYGKTSDSQKRATFAMLERISYIHQKIKAGGYPNTQDLLSSCRKNLMLAGEHLSTSTISRDIDRLKNVFNAPIAYDRFERGYYYEKDFDLEIENSNWIMGM